MARWRLRTKHYLKVPDNEWEYRETNRDTGREERRRFNVPRFLDPEEPGDWTDRARQEIIVTNGNNPGRGDIPFEGDPTPDMEALDDEAEAISAALAPKWRHPINDEFVQGGGYSASLLNDLTREIDKLAANRSEPVSLKGVDPAEFAKMQSQLAELMAQNAQLQEQAAKPKRI